MATEIVVSGFLGALGGLVRSIIGILKAITHKQKIRWKYFAITVLIGILVGMIAGIGFGYNTRVSILVGYAGTDGLEGVWKAVKK